MFRAVVFVRAIRVSSGFHGIVTINSHEKFFFVSGAIGGEIGVMSVLALHEFHEGLNGRFRK